MSEERGGKVKGGRAVKDTLGIFGTRMIFSGMGVISGVILARWLGPYDRGILAVVLLIPSTVVTLTKLGVSQATVYYINRKEASVDQVASNSLTLALGLGALSAAVVWLLRGNLLSSVLKDVPTWALAFSLVRVPLLLLDNYLYSVLQATGQFGIYNTRLLLSEALRLVLVAIFVMWMNLGLPAAVVTYTLIGVMNMGWLMYTMSDSVRFTRGFDRTLLYNMLAFGVRSYVQVVTAHLLLRIDVYMVQSLLGPVQTAFYALALHFTETVLEVPQAIGLVLYPRLASLGEAEIHRLTAQTCRRTLMVTAPAALALALLGPFVITLWYGKAYAAAGAPLPWASVGVAAMAIFVIITRDFTARSKQRVNTASGVLAVIANVILNLYLIPAYGITGAAFATAISYTGACVILIYFFCVESRMSWTSVLVPTREDIRYFASMAQRGLVQVRERFA
jgi:O-antigen/teichoic acid export membrane protein